MAFIPNGSASISTDVEADNEATRSANATVASGNGIHPYSDGAIIPQDRSIELISQSSLPLNGERPAGICVSFKNLSYTVIVKKSFASKAEARHLLIDVKGHFNPGEMTALMGTSGSGKTTLLDVISGRKTSGKVEGEILYGFAKPSTSFLRRHTGYVEQFDTLCDNLTVYEMLCYTAELKLPFTVSKAVKQAAVERMISKLELASCRDTIIGNATKRGISGGQAKRVNIGVSIVTDPLVLYLDEPTSGLDSFTSEEVMTFVRKLSDSGMCVCASIHSPTPTVFKLFHRLMLLSGGRVAYFGRSGKACIEYFQGAGLARNMPEVASGREAEWIVQLITHAGNHGLSAELAATFARSRLADDSIAELAKIEEGYRGSQFLSSNGAPMQRQSSLSEHDSERVQLLRADELQKDDPRAGKATTVPWWHALHVIFWYRTLRNYKDGMFLSARIVDKAIAGGIIMTLFRGMGRHVNIREQTNVAAALFMWATQPAFGAASYLPTIMLERPLYQRERNDGLYEPVTYYLSKWIQEILLAIPTSLVFCGIMWGAMALQGSFGIFWIAFLLTLLTSIAVSFTFATLCPTLEFANGAVPSFGGTLLFFVGFLIPLNQIPGFWTLYAYFDFLRYPYTAMMVNQFTHVRGLSFECQGNPYSSILEFYGMQGSHIYTNLLALLGFWAFYAVAAFLVLKLIQYGSR